MKNVLFIHKHPNSVVISKAHRQLEARGTITSVTQFKLLQSALQRPYDEVAIIIDSMTLAERVAKIVSKHKNTKDALVSSWCVGSLSLRGGMSVTYKPADVPRQLADMTKTKEAALKKENL